MANNKNLESQTKVLQSLDLYTNNLLNVSKIVGNKNYPDASRSKDLEISTRDFTENNQSSGNLLLRAGKATGSGASSGYVRVFAGADTESNLPSNLVLNPNGTAVFTEQAALTLQAPDANNFIKLEANANGTPHKLTVKNSVTDITGSDQVLIQNIGGSNSIKLDFSQNDDDNVLTVVNSKTEHQSNSQYKLTVPSTTGGNKDTVFTVDADSGANTTVNLTTARMKLQLNDTVVDSDTIKLWTPRTNEGTRYIQLNKADSGIEADSGVPGLKVKNDYTDIEADEKLIIYNNAANKIVMTKSGQTGTVSVDTKTGTVTSTESVTVQVPNGTAGSNTHIILNQNGNSAGRKLEIQSANGLETKVLAGDLVETVSSGSSTETIATGNKAIYVQSGAFELQAQTGAEVESADHIRLTSGTSNYLQLTATDNKLRVQNQTAVINSKGTLLLENAGSLVEPTGTLPANYIKLSDTNTIEEKSGTITLKADDDSNKIVLASSDDSLTATNARETHNTSTEFKVLVPSTATVGTSGTAAGTLLDLTTTTANLSSGAVTVTSTGAYTLNTFGNIQQTLKPATDHTFTITATRSGNNAPENSLKFNQQDSSLTAKNAKTVINTGTLDLDVSTAVTLDTPSLEIKVPTSSSKFTLSADSSDSTLTVGNLNVKTEETLGTSSTAIPVTGYLNDLGLSISNSAVIKSANNGANFKLGFPVTGLSNKALLEIDYTAISEKTFTNNLDVKGNIRIGSFSSPTSVSATSKGISAGFTGYAGTLGQNTSQTIEINSGSIDLDLNTTLDIDTAGDITIDSRSKVSIGETTSSEVKVDATKLTITGDKSGSANNLVIESQSTAYPDVQNSTAKSYVKAEEMHATSDLFVNNVKIWWDSVTNSLVFSKVAIS